MKIFILGQGASGILLGILLKKNNPEIDVTILDHNDKANKKLLATGNGRCNLGNTKIHPETYNNEFALSLYKTFDIKKQRTMFDSLGLMTRLNDNLVYPYSLSSNQVVGYLNKLIKELKVKLVNNVKFNGYEADEKEVKVTYNNKIYKFDKFVIACGGMSTPNLGSDGSMYKILKSHKYDITPLKPGLTPIIVNENVKGIENERLKGNIKLFINNKETYQEEGEVLFKKNGLSGIAVFNVSSIISRSPSSSKIKVSLDLFPKNTEEELFEIFEKYSSSAGFSFLEGIFSLRVAEFIRKNSGAKNLYKFDTRDIKNIVHYCKNMEFTYSSHYDFNSSQVTVGGVSTENVNKDLSSKVENNVYLMGEVLDIDGLCGGYNLMLAFSSSMIVNKAILQENKK